MTSEATTPVGEWVEWHGGENPVPGQMVEVRTVPGHLHRGPSEDWQWQVGSDIIAYLLVSAPAVVGDGVKTPRGDGEGNL